MPFSMPKPKKPANECLHRAYAIIAYAVDSTSRFYDTYKSYRAEKTAGALSYAEQDLLRAMLVFSAAGLDSMLKQLVKDALPVMLRHECQEAEEHLRTWAERRMKSLPLEEDAEQDRVPRSTTFLAKVLTSTSPRDALIELLVQDLIGDSLQSKEQVHKVVKYLGLGNRVESLQSCGTELDRAFKYRNQIVHEMDVDFERTTHQRRNRYNRAHDDMVRHVQRMITIAKTILHTVDELMTELGTRKSFVG